MTETLSSKTREWETVRKKEGPLRLLDLPVDILRLIVKEACPRLYVVYTNNLNSLAMTHSTLYNLAVPLIYARFDIVWPEVGLTSQETKGVDALTYGLSTLCLGSKFAQMTRWIRGNTDSHYQSKLSDNQYAKYTRKFSIGNGPSDLITEYMITKENGKMLGTLVALAVAKMINLDTFIWDMPTGVLSDIFMALASLRMADGTSKLEKVWIRWHDNSDAANNSTTTSSGEVVDQVQPVLAVPPHPPPSPPINPGTSMQPHSTSFMRVLPVKYSESSVEYPTFSVLPALENLTALDIDEISYLDEMAILIERSKSKLRELQIGISQKACTADFARLWDDPNLQQIDMDARWPGESRLGNRRLGGVLGVVFGRVYDIRKKPTPKVKEKEPSSYASSGPTMLAPTGPQGNGKASCNGRRRLDGRLRLKTLGLERIAIHSQVCTKAIDWTVLTSLTILNCTYNETLWKALKRQFQPIRLASGSSSCAQMQFYLALKYIHTDNASEPLISFIKETLAPNTLEVLFLQDRRRNTAGLTPSITVDRIFKGAIKRHRSSLKKLLLDSSAKKGRGPDARRCWMNWMLTSEMVSYITSGRMSNLRELAAAFDYYNWLRSLHVSNIRDYPGGDFLKDLALQIVDIVTLRPEIQLCYVGVKHKCFEIMEARPPSPSPSPGPGSGPGPSSSDHHGPAHGHGGSEPVVVAMDDDDHFSETEGGEETEDDIDDDDDDDDNMDNVNMNFDDDEFTEVSDDADSDVELSSAQGDGGEYFKPRFRLREILFYDDKVAIFKARHGRL
ncbi:hypothetical protein SLS62_009472 [Diatrype stigma]|uniref:F-box domain-containing protein n=1 Tax=Diatrype stigma TaxID=117547 RepID=A0AAN9UEB1_9PEZI